MRALAQITEPTPENPYGLTAKLDFQSQGNVELSLQEKMQLWSQMLNQIQDADTFARMLRQQARTDEEKMFVQLQEQVKQRQEQLGRIFVGAELQNELRNIAKRMGISEDAASRMWYQFSKASNMFANDLSASRITELNGGMSFNLALQAKARHVAWHEIGHSLQYYSAGKRIQEFVDAEGGFPLFRGGKLIRELGPDTTQWTNDDWRLAVNSLVLDAPQLITQWPPDGVGKFEEKMLHLLSGAYYQNEIEDFWKNPSSVSPKLAVALTEAHVELYALKKM
jgi:hypothetical protein